MEIYALNLSQATFLTICFTVTEKIDRFYCNKASCFDSESCYIKKLSTNLLAWLILIQNNTIQWFFPLIEYSLQSHVLQQEAETRIVWSTLWRDYSTSWAPPRGTPSTANRSGPIENLFGYKLSFNLSVSNLLAVWSKICTIFSRIFVVLFSVLSKDTKKD